MPYWQTFEDPEYFEDDESWQDQEDYDEDLLNENANPQSDTLPG
jgi:hypothetical protein